MDTKGKKAVIDSVTLGSLETEALLSIVAEKITPTKISGKTREEWWAYFKIGLPFDINPSIVIIKLAEISKKRFIAYQQRTAARARRKAVDGVITQKRAEAKQHLKAEKVMKMKSLAEAAISDISPLQDAAKEEEYFWVDIVNYLNEQQDVLKQINFAHNNDVKAGQPGLS